MRTNGAPRIAIAAARIQSRLSTRRHIDRDEAVMHGAQIEPPRKSISSVCVLV